jgi:predicted signal transduction protein with EAL and GGDEF domain
VRLVAGDSAYVARLGGDELVVVLPAAAGAAAVAERLLTAVADPVEVDGVTLSLSASAGLTICPPTPLTDALQHADASMYEAKQQGRGRLHVFDPAVASRSASLLMLSSALRTAVRDDPAQLTAHYQPVVELTGQQPVALEALARWHHPDLGDVSPARFVDVAQQTGLAARLDHCTMTRAFADFAALVAADVVDASARISVNVAASHLRRRDAGDEILRTAYGAGVAPRQLMIEVNQDALLGDVEETRRSLERLRAQGAWIALDEFGSGTSSITNLRQLPVDVLKIDRAFIRNLTDGGDDLAIVASLIDLAHALGVTVIAEGVETHDQRRLLVELKCDQAQGYLWSRPVSCDALPDVLHDLTRSVRVAEAVDQLRPREAARPAVAGREHGLLHMLELRREGKSPATIAAALNAQGFRTPEGLRWQHGSVLKALPMAANCPDSPAAH